MQHVYGSLLGRNVRVHEHLAEPVDIVSHCFQPVLDCGLTFPASPFL
jgi:hypothetical protein